MVVYSLTNTSKKYGVLVSTENTKVIAYHGAYLIRAKIPTENKIIDQVRSLNYLGYSLTYEKGNYIEHK